MLYYVRAGAPVGMWTWGRVHTKFSQPPQPYLNQGGQVMPTLYWCPHQVLKATGAPALAKSTTKILSNFVAFSENPNFKK